MNDSQPAVFEHLAPVPPRSARTSRYCGDDRGVSLTAMSENDARDVRALYADVTALRGALQQSEDLDAALSVFDPTRTIAIARSIGRGADYPDERMRQALHDVRGGALTSLSLLAHRHRQKPGAVAPESLRILATDHLKIMRNAVVDLDSQQRQADLEARPHSIDRIAATLERAAGEGVDVALTCSFRGTISMSCMEVGTLDRAALNLLNNALRHAARGPVRVWLAPTDPTERPDLRVVVANFVDGGHARALAERFSGDLSRIFVERFTTTGSGEGMHLCAQLVSAAYGRRDVRDATEAGLVGARLVDDEFVAWLHWPAVE